METTHPLKQWRTTQRKKAQDLAAELEISGAHLSNIEKGQKGASLDLALRIEKVTGGAVRPADLARTAEAAQ